MGNYKNFELVVYFVANGVKNLKEEELRSQIEFFNKYMRLDRKVFIVTDDGVPREYAEAVAAVSADSMIYTVKAGEGSKSLGVMEKLLMDAIELLSPREKEIITLRFGIGTPYEKTQKEVADMMGISQSYISRLEKRIIARLKREIVKNI